MSAHTPQAPCDCYIDHSHIAEGQLMACPLHAAAPRMLANARSIVERLHDLPRYLRANQATGIADLVEDELDKARVAIAQAKGEK